MTDRPNHRYMPDGRPMQCKDIPDATFLDAVRAAPGTPYGGWRMCWEVHAELESAIGPVPGRLFTAKAASLIRRGVMGGCPCGCRGDYHFPGQCPDRLCCPKGTP